MFHLLQIGYLAEAITLARPANNLPILKEAAENKATTDLANLLASSKYSDVVVCVDKNKWNLHKNILTARCPVFAAMFECDLKEAAENVIELHDVKPDVFSSFINFIYCGKLGVDFEKHAAQLLKMADKVSFCYLNHSFDLTFAFFLSYSTTCQNLNQSARKHFATT